MIMVYPHNADWDHIAELTGDPSWRADNMRQLFRAAGELPPPAGLPAALARLTGMNPTRHGWNGWLHDGEGHSAGGAERLRLVATLLKAPMTSFAGTASLWPKRLTWFLQAHGDPNDWRPRAGNAGGRALRAARTRTNSAQRHARAACSTWRRRHPDRLQIELNALATRVLFDGKRAVGVEYLNGERLYRAHPADHDSRVRRSVPRRRAR